MINGKSRAREKLADLLNDLSKSTFTTMVASAVASFFVANNQNIPYILSSILFGCLLSLSFAIVAYKINKNG